MRHDNGSRVTNIASRRRESRATLEIDITDNRISESTLVVVHSESVTTRAESTRQSGSVSPVIVSTAKPILARAVFYKSVKLNKVIKSDFRSIELVFDAPGYVNPKVELRRNVEPKMHKTRLVTILPPLVFLNDADIVPHKGFSKTVEPSRKELVALKVDIIAPIFLPAEQVIAHVLRINIEVGGVEDEVVLSEEIVEEGMGGGSESSVVLSVAGRLFGVAGGLVGDERPVLVLLRLPRGCYYDDSCRLAVAGLVARVLGEVYRVNTGGVAQTSVCRGRLSDCLLLERAAGRVTLVLPPAGGMGSEEKRLLGDRVAELAYQGYGFFIVVLPPEEDSGEGSIVPGELFASRGYIGEFTAYGVAARVLDFSGSSPGELLRLARFVLGLTGPADTRLEEELSWDSLGRSIALYEDLVGRVIRGIVGQMQAEVAASSGEESLTHYTGKAVAVKVLRSRAQSIETEKNLGDIIVDVYLVTKEGRGIAM